MSLIKNLTDHLEKYQYSPDTIQKVLDALIFVYIAEGVHQDGVLVSNIHKNFEKEANILLNLKYIKKHRAYNGKSHLEVYFCKDESVKLAKELLKEKITQEKNEILNILSNLPKIVLFYWLLWRIDTPFWKSDYYISKDLGIWEKNEIYLNLKLNEPDGMKNQIDDFWNQLISLKLIAYVQNFVNAGIREYQYVIPPEIKQFIDEFINNNLLDYLKLFKSIQFLYLYSLIEDRENADKFLQESLISNDLTLKDLEKIISYLYDNQITSTPFVEDFPPFSCEQWEVYRTFLSQFLFDETMVANFIETPKITQERSSVIKEIKNKVSKNNLLVIVDGPNTSDLDLKDLSNFAHKLDNNCKLIYISSYNISSNVDQSADRLGFEVIKKAKEDEDIDTIVQDKIDEELNKKVPAKLIIIGSGDKDYATKIKNTSKYHHIKFLIAVGNLNNATIYKIMGLEILYFPSKKSQLGINEICYYLQSWNCTIKRIDNKLYIYYSEAIEKEKLKRILRKFKKITYTFYKDKVIIVEK